MLEPGAGPVGGLALALDSLNATIMIPPMFVDSQVMLLGLLGILLVAILGGVAWYAGLTAGTTREDTAATTGTDGPAVERDSAPQPPEQEPEEISDEAQVIRLLEQNGGRMKQVNIVESTDWSKSKVSMLLSDMEDEGEISKLRVGRENIISLAGEEPDAAGSPFEEQ